MIGLSVQKRDKCFDKSQRTSLLGLYISRGNPNAKYLRAMPSSPPKFWLLNFLHFPCR